MLVVHEKRAATHANARGIRIKPLLIDLKRLLITSAIKVHQIVIWIYESSESN